MTDILVRPTGRRAFLGGIGLGGAALALPGCTGLPGFSLVDAIQRILFLSSERAFTRMLQPDGFWDEQVATVGLEGLLGARGGVLSSILTSPLFKDRLYDAFGDIAYEGAERAAPLVTEAVRTIGIRNAIDLVNGGPTAATAFLRGSMGGSLIEAMVPELGDAMRLAQDPLVGQALAALTGTDIPQVASRVSTRIDDTIWREIGVEESAIRADPAATRDPLIIGVFGTGARL
ncbi:DUF4197 domain-containing protein [Qipengyuania gelatinilytica]|uniref:DUF4197 domain-containing protein n=1 Tax=Qipengyuania gelatinilytica TaxID=2867231 RepID=A0ABX9A104_9SPHN|nr:DUF4197 domain-containing protein [Qipengyuania gelatinilytica]QZD94955.1 DUF4197 domain-containing protein [Qipengyuania gelatinilytica]